MSREKGSIGPPSKLEKEINKRIKERARCEKCIAAKSGIGKIYKVTGGGLTITFDVNKAASIAKWLPSMDVPTYLLERGMIVNDYDEAHLEHVNMDDPVLFGRLPNDFSGACVLPPEARPEDPEFTVFVFLDGSHRAKRALRDGITIQGKFLSIEQTYRCIISTEAQETK